MEKNIQNNSSANRPKRSCVLAREAASRSRNSVRPLQNNSSANRPKRSCVLAREAASRSRNSVRPQQPGMKKSRVNETKNEGMLRYPITINQGQDIEEKIVTYLQDRINSSENSNGCKRMGLILAATGTVLDTENKGSYRIASLGGKYIISEGGQVQQCGPLTIACAGPSCVVYGGQVLGCLVAAGDVQVVVGIFAYDPSEDEVEN